MSSPKSHHVSSSNSSVAGGSGGSTRQSSPRRYDYPSHQSCTGTASVIVRGSTSTWNHRTGVREKNAPTPGRDDGKYYRDGSQYHR